MKGKARRLLSWVCVLALCMSLLPVTALASGTNGNNEGTSTSSLSPASIGNGDVEISKTATRTEEDTWEITMTVKAKEKPIESEPLELVLLLDRSGSMAWCTEDAHQHNNDCYGKRGQLICKIKHVHTGGEACSVVKQDLTQSRQYIAGTAAKDLIDDLAELGVSASVSVVGFSGTDYPNTHKVIKRMTQLTGSNVGDIKDSIPTSGAEGGTYMNLGLRMADDQFSEAATNKVIVMLADGDYDGKDPNGRDGYVSTLDRNGVTVHTIGFTTSNTTLEKIATTTDGKYYTADNADQLVSAFNQIADSLTAMVEDDMGDDVEVVGRPSATNGAATVTSEGKLVWNPEGGKLNQGETATITYTVKLTDAAKNGLEVGDNDVALNGNAVLTYKVGNGGNTKTLDFPLPTDTVEVGQLTTKVMLDGVEDANRTTEDKKVIIYGNDDTFTWSEPDATIQEGDTIYTYSGSTYDGSAITGLSTAATAGAHTLVHNYVSDKSVTGSPITVEVYLDDMKVNASDYITVSNWDDRTDDFEVTPSDDTFNIAYKYEEYDSADFKIVPTDTGKQYALQAIEATVLAAGGSGSGINNENSEYTLDNVGGGSTVKVYFYTSYSVKYYTVDGTFSPVEVGNDTNTYVVSNKEASGTVPTTPGVATESIVWVDSNYKTAVNLIGVPENYAGWYKAPNGPDKHNDSYTGETIKAAAESTGDTTTVIECYAIKNAPALEVTKTASLDGKNLTQDSMVAVGDTITYTIKVENTGNMALSNIVITDTMSDDRQVVFAEDLPDGVTLDPQGNPVIANLESGGSVEITATYQVTDGDAGGTISNTAVATAEGGTTDEGTTPDITVENPALSVTKAVFGATGESGKAEIGNELTYTIIVQNTGNVPLKGIAVSDTLWKEGTEISVGSDSVTLDNGTYTIEELDKDSTVTITYTYTVQESDAGNVIKNVVTATVPDGPNGSDETETTVEDANPAVSISKELTKVNDNDYKDGNKVNVGDQLTYTVTVINTGNVTIDLEGLNLKDTVTVGSTSSEPTTIPLIPNDQNKEALAVGETITLTYTYMVPETAAGQIITNSAVLDSEEINDGDGGKEEVPVTNPKMEVTKELTLVNGEELTEFTVQKDDVLTYQITVTNTGEDTLTNVVIKDTLWTADSKIQVGGKEVSLEGDSYTISSISKGEMVTITYTYTVIDADVEAGYVKNNVAVTSDGGGDGGDEVTVGTGTITIQPANITIYTGGDGYGGVTNESGAIIDGTEASGLPEPGYHIELPDAVVNWLAEQDITASGGDADAVAEDLSKYLTFTYDDNSQTRNWSMDYAGIYATNEDTGAPTRYVYTLNPANVDGEEIPVRLLYKNGEEVVSTDDILMSETLVSDQFSMTINPGELTQSQIRAKLTVEGQSISCNIDIQPGTLTVRSTTDKDTTTKIVDSQENVTGNTITAVDGGEVQYYVNDSKVKVDADRVQLLVDEVSNGDAFNAAMGADSITKAGVNSENAAYDLAYMDLVDTQNGNTVVTMDEGDSLTIYWPVPEDAAEDSEFHVVHYTGMDRENTVDADKLSAQAADVKTGEDAVEKVTIGDQEQEYVKFTTSSFSPFALVYEKAPDPVASLDVTKTLTAVNGKTPGSSVSVGDTLTYTITVTNNGNVDLTNVTVTDTMSNGRTVTWVNLPDGVTNENGTLTITSLAAGTSVELTATYKVLRADASSNLVNTAKVTGTNPGDPGNPVTDEVQTPETPVNPYHPPIRPPVDPDKPELNTEDHYAYIVGYEDGSVQPEGDITRAEVATIFFRLLTDESRNEYWSQTNPYSDVSADDWFNNAVSTLTNAGVLDGYEDGTFKPNGNITRAEFATITARFFEATYDGENLFPDIEGHWAQDYINEAANAGIVNGYEDGTFRPQQYITRAEAVTMVNRTIERHPDADHLLDDMITWPDNPETAWYYEQIQEATNSHEYTMNTDDEQNPYEIWTKLLPNRDWSELEKEWSDANDGAGSGEVV